MEMCFFWNHNTHLFLPLIRQLAIVHLWLIWSLDFSIAIIHVLNHSFLNWIYKCWSLLSCFLLLCNLSEASFFFEEFHLSDDWLDISYSLSIKSTHTTLKRCRKTWVKFRSFETSISLAHHLLLSLYTLDVEHECLQAIILVTEGHNKWEMVWSEYLHSRCDSSNEYNT